MRRKRKPEEQENLERWLITYSDLITLLLAFFIMMYTFSKHDSEKYRELTGHLKSIFTGGSSVASAGARTGNIPFDVSLKTPAAADDVKEKLEEKIRKLEDTDSLGKKISVITDERGIVIRVLDEAFFDLGKADLKARAKRTLDTIAPIIGAVNNPLRVEGHTDDIPISTAEFRSNWELSVRRATEVVRYLIEKHDLSPRRISAVGYAEYHPVAPNDTAENRSRNRRIEIIISRSVTDDQKK
ncbi:MAG: Motility protein B [Syntrophorhabdus sp. PtaB.Bin184]|nr:MAG: Motility protein B [Syntrophorhabdus sp. PtaB.Bin184]